MPTSDRVSNSTETTADSGEPFPAFHGARGRAGLTVQGAGFHESATLAWVRAEHGESRPETLLHPQERAYYSRIPSQRRRQGYLLGRHAAKYALGAETFGPEVCIQAGAMGQPVLTGPDCGGRDISISHHDDLACAVAGPGTTPITLDLEAVDPAHTDAILAKTSKRERALCSLDFAGDPHEWATVLWTAKEALSKFLRCGLGCDLQVLELAGLWQRGDRLEGGFRNFPQYRFISWVPAPGYVLTLVLPTALTLSVASNSSIVNTVREDLFDA